MKAGLPRPETQIRLGRRRVDMGWREYQVGVEYDGEQHWTDPREHAGDIGRLEYLAGLGWTIVRVSAWHLRCDRDGIVHRAEAALRAAGWAGTLSPKVDLLTALPAQTQVVAAAPDCLEGVVRWRFVRGVRLRRIRRGRCSGSR